MSLANQYNVNESSIRKHLKKNGITVFNNQSVIQRKFSANDFYFDEIDSEEKAYFLGFLYADGYNHEELNGVHINLQAPDKYILERFNVMIGSNRPLLFLDITSKYPNRQNIYRFSVFNKRISQRLAQLGCYQRKSLTLKFPGEDIIRPDLLRHFIRGHFDGDGSFYKTCANAKDRYGNHYVATTYRVCITSSEFYCRRLRDILIEKLGVKCYYAQKNTKSVNPIADIRMQGKYAFIFLDWVYEGATIFLHRKHDAYIRLKPEYFAMLKKPRAKRKSVHAYPLKNNPTFVCPGPPI